MIPRLNHTQYLHWKKEVASQRAPYDHPTLIMIEDIISSYLWRYALKTIFFFKSCISTDMRHEPFLPSTLFLVLEQGITPRQVGLRMQNTLYFEVNFKNLGL